MKKSLIKLDGYKQFFEICNKEIFFDFGLKNIISIDAEKSKLEWEKLKNKISNKESELFIRNSGRNGNNNQILRNLYNDIFKINIKFDLTNNDKPSQLLQKTTGLRKNREIFNYQISHVFGNTKNVYCFTAPWNIVFIPKILDPFTGHEAQGVFIEEFQKLFRKKIFEKFKLEILDYNKIINTYQKKINSWIEKYVEEKRKLSILKDFFEVQNYS